MADWHRRVAGSVVRHVDLDEPWELQRVDRADWADSDVVVVEVVGSPPKTRRIELKDGRMAGLGDDDWIMGALGTRHATLEAVGTWRAVGEDGAMHLLTSAGLLGLATSVSPMLGPMVDVQYVGHVVRDGHHVNLADTVPEPLDASLDGVPVILLIGTSMSAGKTTAGGVIVHRLKSRGLRVVAAKFTGAGRYRDVLAMRDAGADAVFDFVDVGLPSTVVDPALCRQRLQVLESLVAAEEPDVAVIEAGASPLEPYNGQTAMELLGNRVTATVLCASDPYAVVGVLDGFGRNADLVTGLAATTSAGIELIERLTDLPACNVMSPRCHDAVDRLIDKALGTRPGA